MKKLVILIVTTLMFSSCTWFGAGREMEQVELQCAETRLDAGFEFHYRAKDYFRSYYKTRKESELFFAWYASEDSNYMANTVRRCWDKRNKHFFAVRSLFQKNQTLQKLIVQNMRQDSQARLSELYLDEYREIFVRDIQ